MNNVFARFAKLCSLLCICTFLAITPSAFAMDQDGPGEPDGIIEQEQLAACNARVEAVKRDPTFVALIESVKGWCDLSKIPTLRGPPTVRCCRSDEDGCKRKSECQSYNQQKHLICVCKRASCNLTDETLKEHLWEEYWHALQNCLKMMAKQGDNPYPFPTIVPEQISVDLPAGLYRCTPANTGNYSVFDWCMEINAKCNNPLDHDPMTRDDCLSFCGTYGSGGEGIRKCCKRFCDDYFTQCCSYLTPPVSVAPTPTPTATPARPAAKQTPDW